MMRLALRTIEQTIHRALQKIDASNPEMRNKLYQTTWQAHEKVLDEAMHMTEAEKFERREHLKNAIQAIEATFQQPAMAAQLNSVNATDPALVSIRPEKRGKVAEKEKRGPLRSNGFLLVLVAILLFVAWLFYNRLVNDNAPLPADPPSVSDSISSLITQDRADSSPSTTQSTQESTPPERQWIRIFDPENIDLARIRGAAHVQLHEEDGVRFLRLQTNRGEDGIVIEIGSVIMARSGAKSAIFNMIARNPAQATTRLSVACDFGVVTPCGRWRFELPSMRDDLLFGVDIPNNVQMDMIPTIALSLSGEVSDENYEVDIFGLEVSFDE